MIHVEGPRSRLAYLTEAAGIFYGTTQKAATEVGFDAEA
jgi:hypothetical protein